MRYASTSRPPSPSGSPVASPRGSTIAAKSAIASPRLGPRSSGGRLQLCVRDQAVERIVLPHRRDQRTRQIDAELPVHPLAAAVPRRVREGAVRRVGELARPGVEHRLPGRSRHLIERVHPLREVVEVLAVAIPLEPLVDRLVGAALGQRLADPEPAARRVGFTVLLGEPADPSGAAIVGAMSTEDVMHPIDQLERQLRVARVSRHVREAEEVAHGERVGPQVALWRAVRGQTRALREPRHQLDCLFGARSHDPRAPARGRVSPLRQESSKGRARRVLGSARATGKPIARRTMTCEWSPTHPGPTHSV